jgi:Acetyltransferase (GNAT) domain
MLRFERLDLAGCDWGSLDALPDRVLGQTREWLEFLAETQRGDPVVARLLDGEGAVGYFSGLLFRRFGVRILGSPFPGWTTPFIGFNLDEGVEHERVLPALERFAFGELGCVHLELRDKTLRPDVAPPGWERSPEPTLLLDLSLSEEELLGRMSSSRRRNIRLAERNRIVVEEATDIAFADDYYAQLKDVFAKQSLVPTYGVERVRALIRHLLPTGRLLLLRALTEEGCCVATGIYPGFNGVAQFWGGASWRSAQHLRPNEAVMWQAIRTWQSRGVRELDMGHGAAYKRAWGDPVAVDVPYLRRPRVRGILRARQVAKDAVHFSQRARGTLRATGVGRSRARAG